MYMLLQLSLFENKKISFSVPTGNFGDAYAGYLVKVLNTSIENNSCYK